jgi:hypothetical protein
MLSEIRAVDGFSWKRLNAGALPTCFGILRKAFPDEPIEAGRHHRLDVGKRFGIAIKDCRDQSRLGVR